MKHLTKWFFALVCLVLVFCVLPVSADAADANGDGYDDAQVEAINALIASSDLKNSCAADEPAYWDFVEWNSGGEVEWLDLYEVTFDQADAALDMSVFPALEILDCSCTNVAALDVTQNPALTALYCEQTEITELDLSGNPLLECVFCQYTGITEIDVSNNPELRFLDVSYTGITALDVSNNPALEELDCGYTGITALDVSHNPALEELDCDGTAITSLDVSQNPALTELICYRTGITEIDVSANPALEILDVFDTGITALDLSGNPELIWLDCCYTGVTSLDLSNNPVFEYLYCTDTGITELDLTGCENLYYVNAGGNAFGKLTLPDGKVLTVTDPANGELYCEAFLGGGAWEVCLYPYGDPGYYLKSWIGLPEDAEEDDVGAYFTLTENTEVSCVFGLDPITQLQSVTISGVTLSPAFDPDVLSYTAEVENDVTSIDIGAVALEAEEVEVTGTGKMNLNVGENVFRIKVTYDEDCSREYVITVTRKAAAAVTPTPTPAPEEAPRTGDSTMLFAPVLLGTMSVLAAGALSFLARKKEN